MSLNNIASIRWLWPYNTVSISSDAATGAAGVAAVDDTIAAAIAAAHT